MDVEKYAYYVNKRRQIVGLETWKWRQIVTSQTAHTKCKWPPYDPEQTPPWKFSAYGILLDTELSDDKDIQRQLRYQYCAANKLRASFSRCSNADKNVIFRSFCVPMDASQLCGNFRKSCMQRLWVAYNFGCRALYNLPWGASVSSHQVQCNIPTFEALLHKYKYRVTQKDVYPWKFQLWLWLKSYLFQFTTTHYSVYGRPFTRVSTISVDF